MNRGVNLQAIQWKIQHGGSLDSHERYWLMKSANRRGHPSLRKFTGLKEYPDSVIDVNDIPMPQTPMEY